MKRLLVGLFLSLALPATAQAKLPSKDLFILQKESLISEITRMKLADQREIVCLATNIYHEARSDTNKSKWGVGLATRNRLKSGVFGDTYCEVIWSDYSKKFPQFPWIKKKTADLVPRETKSWEEIQRIAYLLYVDRDIYDFTGGTTHFHNHTLSPIWSANAKPSDKKRYGKHIFVVVRLK